MRALTLVLALVTGPVGAQTPVVVTDIAPVHSLVAQVMGDLAQPRLLLDAASDPHHFQMRPSQARTLSEADLLIWMGPALTPWLDRSRTTVAPSARSLPLLDAPDPPLRITGTHAHRHDEAASDHSPEHDKDDALDPHAWLDPLSAAFYLGEIATGLAAIDPANADIYAGNARRAAEGLETLHASLVDRLAPVRGMTLIATHDGFSYLLTRYDLHVAGTLTDSAGNAAGAARLRALRQEMAEATGPVCVLRETGTSAEAILNLGPAEPPKIADLDPMGRDHPPGPGLYAAMMRDLADRLAACSWSGD